MPYIMRDESQNISTMHSTEAFPDELFNVSSISCSSNIVTVNLSTPQTLPAAKITRAIVTGANNVDDNGKSINVYNGKFNFTKVNDTQLTYTVLKSNLDQPTGNIKVQFALEYLANDDPEIVAINTKFSDIGTLTQKRQELCQTDCLVVRHHEETCATGGITTLNQTEFDTLHSTRNTLRAEISALEAKLGI